MSNIKVIKILSSRPDYSGTGPRGAYTIVSRVAELEVDGNHVAKATIKTFDKGVGDKMIEGAILTGELDPKDSARGYGDVYKVKSASGSAPVSKAQASASNEASKQRDLSIIAQCCLKAAAEVVAASMSVDDRSRLDAQAGEVVAMADKFMVWVDARSKGVPQRPDAPPDDLPFGEG